MSLTCICMSLIRHPYVLVCHSYVTRMYSYVTRMCFYHEPTKQVLRCNNSRCTSETSLHSTQKNESRKSYQINTISTLGMKAIGKGKNATLNLFAILNVSKTVIHVTWATNTEQSLETSSEVTDSNLEMAAKQVHSITNNKRDNKFTGAISDRTWDRRGWQAKEGAVTTIAKKTYKMIDIARKTSCSGDFLKNLKLREDNEMTDLE